MDVSLDPTQNATARVEFFLFTTSRYNEAEKELRLALAQQPNDATLHAYLAQALLLQHDKSRNGLPEKVEEALKEAQTAIQCAPDEAFGYTILSMVQLERGKVKEAHQAASSAISIQPDYAPYHVCLTRIYIHTGEWNRVVETAEAGLKHDPTHTLLLNYLIMGSVKLRQFERAEAAMDAALRKNPNHWLTRANQGWLLLHRGLYEKSFDAFRESLRLEPSTEWAHLGLVEAMKARNWLYRPILSYSLWMASLSKSARWWMNYGFGIFGRVVRILSRFFPPLAFLFVPWLLIWLAFIFLNWSSDTLFLIGLRFDRLGRQLLKPQEFNSINWIMTCAAASLASLIIGLITWNGAFGVGSLGFLMMMGPLNTVCRVNGGCSKVFLIAWNLLMGIVLLASIIVGINEEGGLYFLFGVFLVAWLLVTLIGNWFEKV